jgi:octaprenyl-diphosphate synthase
MLKFMAMTSMLDILYKPIQDELHATQAFVGDLWGQALALVHGPSITPPKVGGKLLRPAICLLSAGVLGAKDMTSFTKMAAACELLHLAALTHDDVIDKADLRRGAVSLNVLWDNRTAILSGDYLVARSVEILTEYGSCPLMTSIFGAVRSMTEGELQNFGRNPDDITVKDCIQLSENKTATFFATACTAPTYILNNTHRDALNAFGMDFGVAFQLIDDILDITQSQDALGKPSCGDIVEGKRTLPIIFARETASETDRNRLNSLLGAPITDDDRAWAAKLMESTGAQARTMELAREYVNKAKTDIDQFPASPYKDSMRGLAEFILVRDS